MCGICGIIDFDEKPVENIVLHQMMQRMKYRGPDDEGTFIKDNVGLGFVRLSIIDLSSAGHQPFLSEDGRYVIVFNGEIYNYIELRNELLSHGEIFRTHTDTEVLLKAFIYWGESCLNRLNGMFAFVVYDLQKRIVFGARDRYGIKPFYYCLTTKQFVFGSEIPAILSSKCIKPSQNDQVIYDYLVFNRTDQTEDTFFSGIKKLQHGECFTIVRNQFSMHKWYNLSDRVLSATPFKDPDEYRECLSHAVSLRLRSDVPVGVCLSGGLDSSSILSLVINQNNRNDINTFSAVYGKGVKCDESEYINCYRNDIQNMHFVKPDADTFLQDIPCFVSFHGEPVSSLGAYAQYKVMQLAKRSVVVTLDGQGADEELAGYQYFFGFYFKDLFLQGKIRQLISEMAAYKRVHHSNYAIETFAYLLLPQSMRTTFKQNMYGYLNPDFSRKYASSNSISCNLYGSNTLYDSLLDHFEFKLEHLLKWDDRNSMANSIESRVPFLDFELVEKTLATPSNNKIHQGITKCILRDSMKDILPSEIRLRQDKNGFDTPQDYWFRTSQFRSFISDLISDSSFMQRDIFDNNKVRSLYQEHIKNQKSIANEIWKWINLELWFRYFID